MNYKIGFWIALMVVVLVTVGVVMIADEPTPKEPLLTKTEDTRTDFLDTTFTMQTRSSDAIVMEFEIEASFVDKRDIYQIKNEVYEASLQNGALFFYNGTISGTINDDIWLTNATIIGMSFEQYFMDLIYYSDTIPNCRPPETQLPVNVIK